MKPLGPDFEAPYGLWEKKTSELSESIGSIESDKADGFRQLFLDAGFGLKRFNIVEPHASSFLAVDSSLAVRQLRYNILWTLHTVALYSSFDGKEHEDPLLGQEDIPYGGLMYDSAIDAGILQNSWNLDSKVNAIRSLHECKSLKENQEGLGEKRKTPDFLLFDGSLQSTLRFLGDESTNHDYCSEAKNLLSDLIKNGKMIGLVEDSHATDITSRFDLNISNLWFAHLVLRSQEYFCIPSGGVNVCYIKLPSKKVGFLPSRRSNPVTVRWEFGFPDFDKDLNLLASLWMQESDLVHSQLFPVRIADYLTRRISASGLLDQFVAENDLELSYRDMREG
ncbi:DNA double-strand break repair nuclease NurA [Candidatus Altiarchaeota archaeon]